MTRLDRLLQRWRISKAARFVRPGARVLDVGCADAALSRQLPGLSRYLGVDPSAVPVGDDASPRHRVLAAAFPDGGEIAGEFDAVVMLATLEHFPEEALGPLARRCWGLLAPGGLVIITVPSPVVDRIVAVLSGLGLVHGEELGEAQHHGFDVETTLPVFGSAGFALERRESFQLGLNNLFVFRKLEGRG